MFCETIAEMAAEKAIGGSIVKAFIFEVMPIAAEAATPPITLTVAMMNMKDTVAMDICIETGRPM